MNCLKINEMSVAECEGWGIYHEMISPDGSYAYVVDLSDGKKQAKYDEFYGTPLSTMKDNGSYLTDQTGIQLARMITGVSPMSAFDDFVKTYASNGGDAIITQINKWYAAEHPQSE